MKIISISVFIIVLATIVAITLSILHQFNEPARLCLEQDWKGNVTIKYAFFKPNTFLCESYYNNGGKQGLVIEDYILLGDCYRTKNCLKK